MGKPIKVSTHDIAFDIPQSHKGQGIYYRRDADNETNLRKAICKACYNEIKKEQGKRWICGYIREYGTIYYWSEFTLCKKCHNEVITLNPEKKDDFG